MVGNHSAPLVVDRDDHRIAVPIEPSAGHVYWELPRAESPAPSPCNDENWIWADVGRRSGERAGLPAAPDTEQHSQGNGPDVLDVGSVCVAHVRSLHV